MNVGIEDRAPVATAVVRSDGDWRAALDEVWAHVRAAGLAAGRNVMLYDGDRTEVGVELDGAAGEHPRVFASSLPGGPTVVALRRGELSPAGIAEAHAAARDWAAREGVALRGSCWEIYGHMNAEPFELLVGWPLTDPAAP